MTTGVIEEVDAHMALSVTYTRWRGDDPWRGSVPFLYAAKNATGLGDLFKPTLQLSPPSLTTNGLFQFTASGTVPGKTNFFQFTTNVSATPGPWINLLTNVLTTNRFNVIDTNSSNSPQRYYRLLETY